MTFVARACSKRIPQAEAPKVCSSDFKSAILLRSLTQRSSLPLTHAAHALALAFATSRKTRHVVFFELLRWGWSWCGLSAGFSACTSPLQVMHPSTYIGSSIAEDCPCLVNDADLVLFAGLAVHVLPMTFAHAEVVLFASVCMCPHPPSLSVHPPPHPHTAHTHACECGGQCSEIQDAKQDEQQQQTNSFRVGEGAAHKTMAYMCTLGISIAVVTASFDSVVSMCTHAFAMHKKAKRPFSFSGWKKSSQLLTM